MSYPLVALAMLAAAMTVPANGPGPSTPDARLAAMRVARDPETGRITAPAEPGPALTIEAMQDLARVEAAGLVTLRNADGSETLNHEGRFADFSVIRIAPDGRREFLCAHGRFGTEHALRHATPGTPTTEDR